MTPTQTMVVALSAIASWTILGAYGIWAYHTRWRGRK